MNPPAVHTKLSTRLLKLSLIVAVTSIAVGAAVFFSINYKTELDQARLDYARRASEFQLEIDSQLQRRLSVLKLLVANPAVFNAAWNEIARAGNPENSLGTGLRAYVLERDGKTIQGGELEWLPPAAPALTRPSGLEFVRAPQGAGHGLFLCEVAEVHGGSVLAIRVLWDMAMLDSLEIIRGRPEPAPSTLALASASGDIFWKSEGWPASLTPMALPVRARFPQRNGMTLTHAPFQQTFRQQAAVWLAVPSAELSRMAWAGSRPVLMRSMGLLGVAVATLLCLMAGIRYVLRPLEEITSGIRRIGEGELDMTLPIRGNDEVALLGETVNELTARLREKERSVQAYIGRLKDEKRIQEEMAEQLRVLDRVKDDFLAAVSHELRSPLTAIMGYAEGMLDGLYGKVSDKQREVVSYVLDRCKRLHGLIEDLLDEAQFQAGTVKVYPVQFAIGELVGDLSKLVASWLDKKPDVRFETDIAGDLPALFTDRMKLDQILTNLLGNAIKFTDVGTVRLEVRRGENHDMVIRVEDTGIGISQENLPRIFQKFTQLDAGANRRYGGTGLGLTITRKLVERLGGTISVASELGRGTRFTVVLPVRCPEEEPHAGIGH